MTDNLIQFVIQCIADNNLHAFYTCGAWLRLRLEVLEADKNECQICKAKGDYTRATIVHHEKHVRKHPSLAFSKYYIDENGKKQRQLISVCSRCHELEHPERRQKATKELLTEERW